MIPYDCNSINNQISTKDQNATLKFKQKQHNHIQRSLIWTITRTQLVILNQISSEDKYNKRGTHPNPITVVIKFIPEPNILQIPQFLNPNFPKIEVQLEHPR
ncbi:unnamed protein product [Ilex paraguariensis]|uniref:Uncharacterized protein n=1 Tax=Ilex paraguariensis TaxID=185542 RepID=A0ABC8QLP7_9AQUA